MTIEELNVKISADAENFKKAIADANAAIDAFRNKAEAAGNELTGAFAGLINTDVGTEYGTAQATAEQIIPETAETAATRTAPRTPSGIPSYVPKENISQYYDISSYSRTADVLDLDTNETVIGAVSDSGNGEQPVNITTTVELDGDKIGESVNVYNMRRNKITNGLYN